MGRRFSTYMLALAVSAAGAGFAMANEIAPNDVKINEDNQIMATVSGGAGDAAAGKKWFANRKLGNCLACHKNKDLADQPFHGEVGPELDGVAERYSEAELRAIIVDSKKVFGDQTIMPGFYSVSFGARTQKKFTGKTILSAQQVEDVIAYLKTLKE